jgi:hypothetical protein
VSISNLFLFATLFVLLFVVFGDERGTYLEYAQVPLYGIILTELVLIFLNKRLKNPLLDIVNLVFIVFFILRVPFVYGDGLISDIYIRNVNIDKVGYALYVLNYQLIVLVGCILLLNPAKCSAKISISNAVLARVLNFSALILILNIIERVFFFENGANTVPSIFKIFFALFNYGSNLIILVPLLLCIDATNSFKYKLLLHVQLVICVLLVMFWGSKSGLFQIFAIYLISLMAIHGSSYRVKPSSMLLVLIFLVVAIIMFLLGDIFNKIGRGQAESVDWYELLKLALDNLYDVVNSVSFRIGYLDFYIDKLTQDVYSSAFQVKYYIMGVLDAVSPGFDVFGNAPLVSRSVYNNYFGISDGPNSEAITVFAEAHHLAGFFSFMPYVFVLGIMLWLKKLSFLKKSDFSNFISKFFICYVFYRYMLGFGIDYWLFGDVLYPLLGLVLSFKVMRLHRIQNLKSPVGHIPKKDV